MTFSNLEGYSMVRSIGFVSLLPLIDQMNLPISPPAIVRQGKSLSVPEVPRHGAEQIIPRSRLEELHIVTPPLDQETVVPLPMKKDVKARSVLNLHPLFRSDDGPSMFDVQQGRTGDCYLLATLAAMAEKSPQSLIDMIMPTDATESQYRIKYVNPMDETSAEMDVFDTSYTDQENRPIYAGDHPRSEQKVSWVKVMENWFAKVADRYRGILGPLGFEAIGKGGFPPIPYKIMTGKTMEMYRAPRSVAAFKDQLSMAHLHNSIIVLGTKKHTTIPELPGRHAYAVLGVKGSEVELYNPWGWKLSVPARTLLRNTEAFFVAHNE